MTQYERDILELGSRAANTLKNESKLPSRYLLLVRAKGF